MSEETLPGGNTDGAVRIGDVVHKQASPWTPTVYALLRHPEQAGVDPQLILNQATVTTPDPVGTASGDANELNGVRCTAAAACWAVGNTQDGAGLNRNEILRWNGRKWIMS